MSAAPLGPPPSPPSAPGLDAPLYDASIAQAASRFWRKYAVFSGRASRSEFWWWVLVSTLVSVVLQTLATLLAGEDPGTALVSGRGSLAPLVPSLLWSVATLVPSLALTVRRLHDTNRSGWWYLLAVPGFVGLVVQLVTFARFDVFTGATPGDPRGFLLALLPGLMLMLVGVVGSIILLVFVILGPDPRGARFDRRRAA